MDEIQKAQQDTSQVGDSSKRDKEITSEQPETLTREKLDEIRTKAASDALSAAGRTAKALEVREEAIRTAEERLAQAQKDRDEKEEYEARDDSDKLTAIRTGRTLRELNTKLAEAKRELDEERTKGKQRDAEKAETDREISVFEIATKHTVDAETLKNLSKHTDGSTEAIEALAQILPKKVEAKPPLRADSGKTIGSEASWEQVRDAYIKNPNDPEVRQRYMEMRLKRR